MSVEQLYQDIILDHYKQRHHAGLPLPPVQAFQFDGLSHSPGPFWFQVQVDCDQPACACSRPNSACRSRCRASC